MAVAPTQNTNRDVWRRGRNAGPAEHTELMKITLVERPDGKYDVKNYEAVLHTYDTIEDARAAKDWLNEIQDEFEDRIGCGNK